MSNAKRFAALFRGFEGRYGRYDLAGRKSEKGKEEGRARTVDAPIGLKDYASHIEGKVGIGVIPLREDNTVYFAAIDVDVYDKDAQKKANLTHEEVARALAKTPLIVTSSKSSGIHIWLFSKSGVSAKAATDYLKVQASLIGAGGSEVFPKQMERSSSVDVGNWINLPYFGDSRKAVVPNQVGTVIEMQELDLGQFLEVAELAAEEVTEDYLAENTTAFDERDQRDSLSELGPFLEDGPPCLQTLLHGWPSRRDLIQKKFDRGEITQDQYEKQMAFTNPQLVEGARDNTFFQAAIYLRRRMNASHDDPDAALDKEDTKELKKQLSTLQNEWSRKTGRAGLSDDDLDRIAKQASKGKWGYSCTKEPLTGFCNRRLCLKRRFGVGLSASDSPEITGFTIVESLEPQYFFNYRNCRIHIPSTTSLLRQDQFATAVTAQAHCIWPMMQPKKFGEMLDVLLQNADRIDAPPESDTLSSIMIGLRDFVNDSSQPKGKNDGGIFNGRVLISEDETEGWFQLKEFHSFLRRRGVTTERSEISRICREKLGVIVGKNTTIAEKSLAPYVVNLKHLQDLVAGIGESSKNG
jgi:hypothetical protein